MHTIDLLGLGAMGLPLALRLLECGHAVRAARHAKPLNPAFTDAGGVEIAADALGQGADALISLLPDDAALREVFLQGPLLERLSASTLLLEMSSATPEVMRTVGHRAAGLGLACLDVPVSGGISGARNGTLTLMVGGDAETLRRAGPLLRDLAGVIRHVGEVGQGKAMKLVNQLLAATGTVLAAEALALSRHLGLDPVLVREVVSAGTGDSWAVRSKFLKMAEDDAVPAFTTALMRKDLDNALAGCDGLELARCAAGVYARCTPDEQSLDFSVVSRHTGCR